MSEYTCLLEDIPHNGKILPCLRETDTQIIAGSKGEPLKLIMSSYQTPDKRIHEGFAFPAKIGTIIIRAQPIDGKLRIRILQINKILNPKDSSSTAKLTLLQATDNPEAVSPEYRNATAALIKKMKKPNRFDAYPKYAASNKSKKPRESKFKCQRCGWEWTPKRFYPDGSPRPPKNCPNQKCKSPYWDTPRKPTEK